MKIRLIGIPEKDSVELEEGKLAIDAAKAGVGRMLSRRVGL